MKIRLLYSLAFCLLLLTLTFGIGIESVYAAAPSASTESPTNITSTGATLKGTVNPNGKSTTAYFNMALTSNGQNIIPSPCTDVFHIGGGSNNVPVSCVVSSLSPGTQYHYWAIGTNVDRTTVGNEVTFSTTASPTTTPTVTTPLPTVITVSPSFITTTSAQLRGTVNPHGCSSSTTVEFSTPNNMYWQPIAVSPIPAGSSTAHSVSYTKTGLTPGATYGYLVHASGCGSASGELVTFSTLPLVDTSPTTTSTPPSSVTVITLPSTSIRITSATTQVQSQTTTRAQSSITTQVQSQTTTRAQSSTTTQVQSQTTTRAQSSITTQGAIAATNGLMETLQQNNLILIGAIAALGTVIAVLVMRSRGSRPAPQQMPQTHSVCGKCGSESQTSNEFCMNCGSNLKSS